MPKIEDLIGEASDSRLREELAREVKDIKEAKVPTNRQVWDLSKDGLMDRVRDRPCDLLAAPEVEG